MAKKIEIPGKEVIDSFGNLSVESKMVSRNDKRAKEILDTVRASIFSIRKPTWGWRYYSITLMRPKSWWKIKWMEGIGIREWKISKKGHLELPLIKSEGGFGKFIALASVLYWMRQGDYKLMTVKNLKWEGVRFWANFLGFKNDPTGFVRLVLESDDGSCTFIKHIEPRDFATLTVSTLDEMVHEVGPIEEYAGALQDFTLPYSEFLDRVNEVWGYRAEK